MLCMIRKSGSCLSVKSIANNMKSVLYNGNCLDVMKDIKDESVDLILCDLPYGTTQCIWDSVIPFDALWEQYMKRNELFEITE